MANKKKLRGSAAAPQKQQQRRAEIQQRKQLAQARKRRAPTRLDQFLNPFLVSTILAFLTEQEREEFVKFDPRYGRPKPNQVQQQSQQATVTDGHTCTGKASQEGDNTASSVENTESELENDEKRPETTAGNTLETLAACVASLNVRIDITPKNTNMEQVGMSPEETAAVINKENKPRCPHEREGNNQSTALLPSVSDPMTLLARLNSRRLYQRMRYYKKQHDIEYKYPKKLSTHQMAMKEWDGLLQQARTDNERKLAAQKDRTGPGENEDADAEDQSATAGIPSPYELLMFSPCPRAVTALASYPRSGNSLMRNLFERTSLRVSGSDMRGGLTKHDLVGEAAVGANMVQFVKTHFPERRGTPPFKASRVVLLVRNPYDAIESFFNLMMTGSHTTSLSEEKRQEHNKLWQEHVLKEIQVWRDFHEYWIAQQIPMLLVRYEDLIRFPDKVMSRVLQFVLEVNNMSFFESRLDKCIRKEQIERLGSYKPRSGGIGKSLSKFSPELLQIMNMGIVSTMHKLGYGEMLVPRPELWKLEPVDDFAAEFVPRKMEPIVVNGGKLVRGPQHFINWIQIKREMMEGQMKQCSCEKCTGEKEDIENVTSAATEEQDGELDGSTAANK
jgi:hypothetical protein